MFNIYKNTGLIVLRDKYKDLFSFFNNNFEYPISYEDLNNFNIKLKNSYNVSIKEHNNKRLDYSFKMKDENIFFTFNFKIKERRYHLLNHELSYQNKFYIVSDEHTQIILKNVILDKQLFDYIFKLNHFTKEVEFIKNESLGASKSQSSLFKSLSQHINLTKNKPFNHINRFLTNNFDEFSNLVFSKSHKLDQAYEIEQLTFDRNQEIEFIISGYLFSSNLKLKESLFNKGINKLKKII